jgi:hypothetical protein
MVTKRRKSSILCEEKLETGKGNGVEVSRYASLAVKGSDHLSVMKRWSRTCRHHLTE